MVRLKVDSVAREQQYIVFQFLMVRLKVEVMRLALSIAKVFQFLMVRLKAVPA